MGHSLAGRCTSQICVRPEFHTGEEWRSCRRDPVSGIYDMPRRRGDYQCLFSVPLPEASREFLPARVADDQETDDGGKLPSWTPARFAASNQTVEAGELQGASGCSRASCAAKP